MNVNIKLISVSETTSIMTCQVSVNEMFIIADFKSIQELINVQCGCAFDSIDLDNKLREIFYEAKENNIWALTLFPYKNSIWAVDSLQCIMAYDCIENGLLPSKEIGIRSWNISCPTKSIMALTA